MKITLLKIIFVLLCFTNSYAQNAFPSSGNVGIGTLSPGSALTILSGGTGVSVSPGGSPYFGTFAFNRESATGAIFDPRGSGFQINNGGTDSNLHFQVWNGDGSLVTNNAIVVATNGYIGIGTAAPKESLSVNGRIRGQEVKVEITNWPDYVFKPTYKLPTLSEIKDYVEKNNHLPEMPAEQEVIKNGIMLGEMVTLQTKKIEELTLYLLEKENELRVQQQINQEEQKKNAQQDARIAVLEKALGAYLKNN